MVEAVHMVGGSTEEVLPLIQKHHYSGTVPASTRHCFTWRSNGGLFGDYGEPVAACLFSHPSNRNWPQDALELTRLVRHPDLKQPLSSFVSWCIRWVREHHEYPFILSYADSAQGHHGGIYQATGFSYVYHTKSGEQIGFFDSSGQYIHGRSVYSRYGTRSVPAIIRLHPDWTVAYGEPKFLYIKPLRKRLNAVLKKMNWTILPFPKPDNAACPVDESVPADASQVKPLEAAP
jgi:hypothetical protein